MDKGIAKFLMSTETRVRVQGPTSKIWNSPVVVGKLFRKSESSDVNNNIHK